MSCNQIGGESMVGCKEGIGVIDLIRSCNVMADSR